MNLLRLSTYPNNNQIGRLQGMLSFTQVCESLNIDQWPSRFCHGRKVNDTRCSKGIWGKRDGSEEVLLKICSEGEFSERLLRDLVPFLLCKIHECQADDMIEDWYAEGVFESDEENTSVDSDDFDGQYTNLQLLGRNARIVETRNAFGVKGGPIPAPQPNWLDFEFNGKESTRAVLVETATSAHASKQALRPCLSSQLMNTDTLAPHTRGDAISRFEDLTRERVSSHNSIPRIGTFTMPNREVPQDQTVATKDQMEIQVSDETKIDERTTKSDENILRQFAPSTPKENAKTTEGAEMSQERKETVHTPSKPPHSQMHQLIMPDTQPIVVKSASQLFSDPVPSTVPDHIPDVDDNQPIVMKSTSQHCSDPVPSTLSDRTPEASSVESQTDIQVASEFELHNSTTNESKPTCQESESDTIHKVREGDVDIRQSRYFLEDRYIGLFMVAAFNMVFWKI